MASSLRIKTDAAVPVFPFVGLTLLLARELTDDASGQNRFIQKHQKHLLPWLLLVAVFVTSLRQWRMASRWGPVQTWSDPARVERARAARLSQR